MVCAHWFWVCLLCHREPANCSRALRLVASKPRRLGLSLELLPGVCCKLRVTAFPHSHTLRLTIQSGTKPSRQRGSSLTIPSGLHLALDSTQWSTVTCICRSCRGTDVDSWPCAHGSEDPTLGGCPPKRRSNLTAGADPLSASQAAGKSGWRELRPAPFGERGRGAMGRKECT